MIFRYWLGLLLTLCAASPSWSQSTPSELNSLCMMVEQIAAAGPCCAFTQHELAELTGSRAGRLLVALASQPVAPTASPPQPTALAPSVWAAAATPPVGGENGTDKRLLLARLHIETRDQDGNKRVICRPQILTIDGQEARVEIAQANGESLAIKIMMQQVPSNAEAERNAQDHAAAPQEPPHEPMQKKTANQIAEDSTPKAIYASPGDAGWTPKPATADFESAAPIVIPSHLGVDWSIAEDPFPNALPSPTTSLPATPWNATQPGPQLVFSPDASSCRLQIAEQPKLPNALDDPYFARKMLYENLYEKKIRKLLTHIPNVQIAVEVELDSYIKRAEEHSRTSGSDTNTIIEQSSPLTPQRVSVAVTFPDSYVVNVWETQSLVQQRPTVDELDALMESTKRSIEQLVETVLPQSGGERNFPSKISICSFTPVRSADAGNASVTSASQAVAKGSDTSPSIDQAATWMLGVIALTLLCASIGAAVLFRQSPPRPPVSQSDATHNDSLIPPRRRAA